MGSIQSINLELFIKLVVFHDPEVKVHLSNKVDVDLPFRIMFEKLSNPPIHSFNIELFVICAAEAKL